MHVRTFVLIGLALALGANPLPASQSKAKRPNIVVVLADDMGYGDLACYGHPAIKSPNLDKFATQGVRFQNSFVCTPICSASRATLFTGRTPMQHGIHDFLTPRPIEQPPQIGRAHV